MSTNYYLFKPACASCGHEPSPLHIGQSAYGWVFALHVYPKEASPGVDFYNRSNTWSNTWNVTINDLDDWLPLFEQYEIRNEYDERGTSTTSESPPRR